MKNISIENINYASEYNNEPKQKYCDVLVQVDNFESGGMENVVLDLNEKLIESGFKVFLLVLGSSGGVKQAIDRGMNVIVISKIKENYIDIVEKLSPRIVLAHYSFYGSELLHERSIPFVQIIHNVYIWFDDEQRKQFSHALKFTSLFIAVSDYVKKYSVNRLGVSENKCIVINNGIDCQAFDSLNRQNVRKEIRANLGLIDQDFVYLSVGAINYQKNHIATVRAFSSLVDKLPSAKLVILGPVHEENLLEEIEEFIAKNKLETKIIYAGSSPTPQKYYLMSDAYVTASRFEGGPLNQLEALKANLSTIMTDVGFASFFKNIKGCQVVAPPLDIFEIDTGISENEKFEDQLSIAMMRTYLNFSYPNLSPNLLNAFDKSHSYTCYIEVIDNILNGHKIDTNAYSPSWTNQIMIPKLRRELVESELNIFSIKQKLNKSDKLNLQLREEIFQLKQSISWKITRPLRFISFFTVNPVAAVYELMKFVYWGLPVSLRMKLNNPRQKFIRNIKSNNFLQKHSNRSENKINSSDLSWKEFNAKILSNRSDYKGIFIQECVIDWNVPLYQRPQHIAAAFGRLGYLVIYKTDNWAGDNVNGFREVSKNVWITNRYEVDKIDGVVRSLYSTAYANTPERLLENGKRGLLIYEYIDHIDPQISGDAESIRRLLALKDFAFSGGADYIVASARKLATEAAEAVGYDKVILAQNGVDTRHYRDPIHQSTPIPENYSLFRKKYSNIVGYFGALAPWLWYEAVSALVEARPDLGFVFIGPDYYGGVEKLPSAENVLYLGTVDYKILPSYARKFDVCFIPFAPGEIARTTSPLKLYEYFALEKPVVVTSEMRECVAFEEVFSGDSPDTLSLAIDKAIHIKNNEIFKSRLAQLADENDWDERARTLETIFTKQKQKL